MQYNQLLYLVEAVQNGSIRKAAKTLGVTQPTLSTAILALEKEIETELLVRTNKGVFLTPEGRRFVSMAQDIVQRTNMLKNIYQQGASAHRNRILSIATHPSQITIDVLRNIKPQLDKDDYKIVVRNLTVEDCVRSVEQLESELGVIFISSVQHQSYMENFEEHGLEYFHVCSRKGCVNVGPNNPLYQQETVDYRELINYPLARFIEDDLSLLDFGSSLDNIGLQRFSRVIYFDSDCSVINFIRQTDAIKLGFSWCNEDYERIGVRCLEISGLHADEGFIELGWIKRKKQELTEAAQMFIDEMHTDYSIT